MWGGVGVRRVDNVGVGWVGWACVRLVGVGMGGVRTGGREWVGRGGREWG